MQKLKAGESTYMNITDAHGVLLFVVLVQLFTDHVSLVFTHHPVLNRAMPTRDGADYLRMVIREAKAGTPVWQIEDRAGHWTTAQAVADQAEQDMYDGINANLDQTQARLDDATVEARQIAADTKASIARTGGWNALRHQYRPVRPTRTNTHLNPLTPAMRNLAAQHRDGVVRLPAGCDWRVLAGIADRGHAEVIEKRGYKVTAVRLNGRGLNAITEASGVAT
jgi:hypothetical protein